MDNRDVIRDVFVHLFYDILQLEETAIITEEFNDITNNDMRIIVAVGLDGGNMSAIAGKLNITVGSLTTSMSSLVKKGYVVRQRSDKDRRVVNIRLTEKGKRAYFRRAQFHMEMVDAALKGLSEEEITVLAKTLTSLADFFEKCRK
ncbi:MAG: winged helix DNA-binding protein [Clostridiales bacterium]|nr:winged helix DNA-binding protein [Clostridiales bacterium]